MNAGLMEQMLQTGRSGSLRSLLNSPKKSRWGAMGGRPAGLNMAQGHTALPGPAPAAASKGTTPDLHAMGLGGAMKRRRRPAGLGG